MDKWLRFRWRRNYYQPSIVEVKTVECISQKWPREGITGKAAL
jgi:hypothetical protein